MVPSPHPHPAGHMYIPLLGMEEQQLLGKSQGEEAKWNSWSQGAGLGNPCCREISPKSQCTLVTHCEAGPGGRGLYEVSVPAQVAGV